MVSTELTAEICAAEVMDTLPVVLHFVRRRIRRFSKAGLSLSQVRALSYLSRFPHSSLSELADFLCVSNASSSTMIDRLIQKGLVDRQADPLERRCIKLSLTKQGEAQYKLVHSLATEGLSVVLSQMPAQKIKKIHEGLALLRDAFLAE